MSENLTEQVESNDTLNYTENTLQHAKKYIKAGLAPLVIARGQKIPLQKDWSARPMPTEYEINKWFDGTHNNIGIRTGKISGVFVLDVDTRNGGDKTLAALELTHGDLPTTIRVETPSGGFHLWFNIPQGITIRNSAGKLGAGLDIRGDGGQVVVPPSQVGKNFYYADGDEGPEHRDKIADPPQWLVDAIKLHQKPASRMPMGYKPEQTLHHHGERNAAIASFAGVLRNRGHSEEAMYIELLTYNELHCKPPLEETEVARIAHSVKRYDPDPKYTTQWREGLAKGAKDQLKGTSGNVTLILLHDSRTHKKIRYNTLEQCIENSAKLPWKDSIGPWTDDDYVGCKQWMANQQHSGYHMVEPGFDATYQGIERAARIYEYNPIEEWLMHLGWDGTRRIDQLLSDHFGASYNSYTAEVGQVMITGAVYRALMPGCKLDYMPILVGPQGCGKTSALEILYGDWYRELTGAALNAAAAYEIQGAWGVEMAELQQYGHSAEEQAKAFITRRIDTYRPPYGRTYVKRPRRCIVLGTTNDETFLRDTTGNRRYLPVHVGEINREVLQAARDQLFAEAMALWVQYDEDKRIWLPKRSMELAKDAVETATQIQTDSTIDDPWQDIIEEFLQGRDKVTVMGLYDALEIPKDRRDRKAGIRIGNIMRTLGYKKQTVRDYGRDCKGYKKKQNPADREELRQQLAKKLARTAAENVAEKKENDFDVPF